MYDKVCNIISKVTGAMLLLAALLLLLVQVPAVQSFAGRKILEKVQDKLDGRISYDDIGVMFPPGALVLKDALILDGNPEPVANSDTLFHARSLTATFSLKGLFRKEGIHLGRVNIEDAVFNLVSEQDSLYHVNLSRIFGLEAKGRRPAPGPDIFDVRHLTAHNMRFTMVNAHDRVPEYHGTGNNYNDLDVTVHELDAEKLKFTGSRMFATCNNLTATENKGGYNILECSGTCAVGQGVTEIDGLHLRDDWSDVNMENFTMSYPTLTSFNRFLTEVRMDADFQPTTLDTRTITYISGGALAGNDIVWDIQGGSAHGWVNDFRVDGLQFKDLTSGLSATVDGTAKGLPDISALTLDTKLTGTKFTAPQLSRFIKSWTGKGPDLSGIAKGQTISVNGNLKGRLDNASFSGTLGTSSAGSAVIDANVRNLLGPEPTEIAATVNTNGLDAGRIAGIEALGPVTLTTSANVRLTGGIPEIGIDHFDIGSIEALGHRFENVSVNGSFSGNSLSARITGSDPAASFTLTADGTGSTGSNDADYTLDGEITSLDFGALGMNGTGSPIKASASVKGRLFNSAPGSLDGSLDIYNIQLESPDGNSATVDNMSASLHSEGGQAHIELFSDILDAFYTGSDSPAKAIADMQDLTVRRHLPSVYRKKGRDEAGALGDPDSYDISVALHDPYRLLALVQPGLYLADSTRINLNVDHSGNLTGSILTPRLAYNGNYLKDVHVDLDNFDCLSTTLTASELKAGGMTVSNPALTLWAADDEYNVQMHYDNLANIGGCGELYVGGGLQRDSRDSLTILARPLDSYLDLCGDRWDISESEITITSGRVKIDGLNASSGIQNIYLDGGISTSSTDTLVAYLDDFELAVIDEFLPHKYGFTGIANGQGQIVSPLRKEDLGMILRLDCDDVAVAGEPVGNISIAGRWDNIEDKIRAFVSNELAGRMPLEASLAYSMNDHGVVADVNMDRFNPALAQPFLAGIFSRMDGNLSGHLTAGGTTDNLILSGEGTSIDSLFIKLVPTGVTYLLNGPLDVREDGLHFDGITISDLEGGSGRLSGKLSHKQLRDMRLDAGLRFNNLLAIDSREGGSNAFYGRLAASGGAMVTGPFNALSVIADVATSGSGDVHVPLNASLTGSTSDLLTFIEREKELDKYEMLMQEAARKEAAASGSDISIKAHVGVSPQVNAMLEIDKQTGNILSAYGTGDVDLEIRPSKDIFSILGDYAIEGGKFHFETAGVIDKDFAISNGGSIKFSGGDIMDSELDVTAVYNLKTSLSTLIADSTAVASRRAVVCGLNISDKLRNPKISFSIDIPDLDPSTKSLVETALNTEDKVQKQFVALLLFGTFLPSEQSGVINGSSMLLSNVSEIMSSQINSILQKLDIPVDLGFGYQPGDGGTDIFDVAISTQLFNNRVLVNGSFGNRQYKSSGAQDNLVGDVDVDVKLDRTGNFRVNLFSHSADEYTSFLDYSQRSGIGVSYRKEYDTFRGLIKDIFGKKSSGTADRRERRRRRLQDRETVTIKIEADE